MCRNAMVVGSRTEGSIDAFDNPPTNVVVCVILDFSYWVRIYARSVLGFRFYHPLISQDLS